MWAVASADVARSIRANVVAAARTVLTNRLASACLLLGGLNGAAALVAAAFARHALVEQYARELVAIGAEFQLVHAAALASLACIAESKNLAPLSTAGVAAAAFALGTILFSGTLYALGTTGSLPVQGAAPAGGFLLVTGWLTVAFLGGRALIARKR